MKSKLACSAAALAAVTLITIPASAQLRGTDFGQARSITYTPVNRANFGQFLSNAGFDATNIGAGGYSFKRSVMGGEGTFTVWVREDRQPANALISLSLLALHDDARASALSRRLPRASLQNAPVVFDLVNCRASDDCRYLLTADLRVNLRGLDENAFRAAVNRLVAVAERNFDLWGSPVSLRPAGR